MEKEEPAEQQSQEGGATMQGSSDCDVLELCKQLQEIRAQLAKARAKAKVDGTIQDKAAAKLDEVCELLQLENQGSDATIQEDGNNASTTAKHRAVDAVADEMACGPVVCAANETVGDVEVPSPSYIIVGTTNYELACETMSTTEDLGYDAEESPPPEEVDGVSNGRPDGSPHNEDHCYAAADTADSAKAPSAKGIPTVTVVQSSEKRPAPDDTQSPEVKKLKTDPAGTPEMSPKSRVIVAGARVPSATPGPVIVRRCILQPSGSPVSPAKFQNSPLPVASHSRLTMVVKAKDAGKPIRVPVHMFSQQSGGPISESSQKLTIVHMKVLQQSPPGPGPSVQEKPQKLQKGQKTASKACQTTKGTRARGRKKVTAPEVIEQEPCTALVKTFPQPERKGRKRRPALINSGIMPLTPKPEPEEIICGIEGPDIFSPADVHSSDSDVVPCSLKCEAEQLDCAAEGSCDSPLASPSHRVAMIPTARRTVFHCELCGDTFTASKHLDWHWRTAHRERPQGKHQCSYCPYSHNSKSRMKRHERTHTGERTATCSVCQKGFYTRHELMVHMRTHTKEKPHKCNECGRCFAASTNLYAHKRYHSEDTKIHACPECGKAFAFRGHLKLHLQKHMGERPLPQQPVQLELHSAERHERMKHTR